MLQKIKDFISSTQVGKIGSKGFTLTEILVVIAIIGILTTVVSISTSSAKKQSRDAKRKADLELVAGALEIYYAQNKTYPLSTSEQSVSNALNILITDGYISTLPEDPKKTEPGQVYNYQTDETGTKYYLDAQLERTETPTISNITANPYQPGTYTASDNKTHYRVASQ